MDAHSNTLTPMIRSTVRQMGSLNRWTGLEAARRKIFLRWYVKWCTPVGLGLTVNLCNRVHRLTGIGLFDSTIVQLVSLAATPVIRPLLP
ncbi:MAG: hypothetical protein GPOALKHO_000164 [Sodalis sp.]|nr:MAG: hypothetical protein GPOALKHO_000164 [Sodalis sp.]